MQKQGKQIKCQICGKYFRSITYKHLKKHNMTLQDYKLKFKETQSENTKNLMGRTLKNYINKFGKEEGTNKFQAYCEKHRFKNTFEGKQLKYGWSKEQFKKHNDSRAVTLENCIKRHGKNKGQKIFTEYCKKQQTAGISKDYFIEKLGIKAGKQKYKEVCKLKGHTLENYQKRYGERGQDKLNEFYSNVLSKNKGTSKIQKEFEVTLTSAIQNKYPDITFTTYGIDKPFATGLKNKGAYIYDYVITYPIKLCIEFNGDFWHANPEKYNQDTYFKVQKCTAKEIWKKDRKKIKHIENMGFDSHIVWEKQYRINKIRSINKCLTKITKLLTLKK